MARPPRIARRTAHTVWLAVSALLAAVVTRGALPVIFLAAFVVIWLLGYATLARLYRR
ncbi:MAG: hypothetical protein WC709_01635 [Thermoleophilia bacterium]